MATKVKMFKIPADYGMIPPRHTMWVDLSQIVAVVVSDQDGRFRVRLRSNTMENLYVPSITENQIMLGVFKDFDTLGDADTEALVWADRIEKAKT